MAVNQRHSVNPPPLVHVPGPSVTSTIVKNESSSASQVYRFFKHTVGVINKTAVREDCAKRHSCAQQCYSFVITIALCVHGR